MKNKLNLDLYRLFASIFIIAIHMYPFASFNEDLDFLITRVLFRVCVPFFLFITGYFLIPKVLEEKENLINYLKKIAKIYIICMILYLPLNIYKGDFKGLTILSLLKAVFINGTFYHLWYFPALLLGISFLFLLLKRLGEKKTLVFVIFLYIIGLFGDSYYGIVKDVPVLKSMYAFIFSIFDYTRNGLFYVPIFLYMGYKCSGLKRMSKKKDICFLFLSLLVLEIEGFLLYKGGIQRHTSMYISLPFVMYFLFDFLLQWNQGSSKKLRTIGTLVYILHPLFIVVVRFLFKAIKMESVLYTNHLLNYSLVVLFTVIFSSIVEKLIEKRRKKI